MASSNVDPLKLVVIHIGTPKTGSSTIQDYLQQNSQALQEDGILFVGPNSLSSFNQSHPRLQTYTEGVEELRQKRLDANAHTIIWSMEKLSSLRNSKDADLDLIRRRIPANRYKIIVYFRRQDLFLTSAHLQWNVRMKTKPGRVPTLDEHFEKLRVNNWRSLRDNSLVFDYYETLKPWAHVFGASSIDVRPFEKRQLTGGDLLVDFCQAAEIDYERYDRRVPAMNVAFNATLHALLAEYHSVYHEPKPPRDMRDYITSIADDEFFQLPFFTKTVLSAEQSREVMEACNESNARLAREYLGRPDGQVFYEPVPESDNESSGDMRNDLTRFFPVLLHIMMRQHQRICHLEAKQSVSLLSRVKSAVLGKLAQLKKLLWP